MKNGTKAALLLTLAAGSLWGLSEVLLDEGIRAAGLPVRAGILVGVGALLCGVVFASTRRATYLLLMPIIAVAMKQLTVPLLGASFMCGANSCLAVGIQGMSMAGAMFILGRKRTLFTLGLGAGAAVLFSAVPFYFAGLHLAPCNYLLSFTGISGFARFMLVEGLVWGALSGPLFAAGILVGRRFLESEFLHRGKRILVAGGSLASATIISWGTAVVVTLLGVG